MHELLNNLTGKLPHTLTNDYLFHIVFQDMEYCEKMMEELGIKTN